jgi:hypothetical protein
MPSEMFETGAEDREDGGWTGEDGSWIMAEATLPRFSILITDAQLPS